MNCPRCGRSIINHDAGLATDICVAEAVMGLKPASAAVSSAGGDYRVRDCVVWLGAWPIRFRPSGDIAAAWKVRDKLIKKGYSVLGGWDKRERYEEWEVYDFDGKLQSALAQADTAPLAICRLGLTVAATEARQHTETHNA